MNVWRFTIKCDAIAEYLRIDLRRMSMYYALVQYTNTFKPKIICTLYIRRMESVWRSSICKAMRMLHFWRMHGFFGFRIKTFDISFSPSYTEHCAAAIANHIIIIYLCIVCTHKRTTHNDREVFIENHDNSKKN